jgi:hypothetical protein
MASTCGRCGAGKPAGALARERPGGLDFEQPGFMPASVGADAMSRNARSEPADFPCRIMSAFAAIAICTALAPATPSEAQLACQDYSSAGSPVVPLAIYDEGIAHLAGSAKYSLSFWITWYGGFTDFGYRIWDLADPLHPVSRLSDGGGGFYLEPFYAVLDVQEDVIVLGVGDVQSPSVTTICDMAADPAYRREFPEYEPVSAGLDLPYAWISAYGKGLVCLDVSDLQQPRLVSTTAEAAPGYLTVHGNRAYLLSLSYPRTLRALDLTDPAAPLVGAQIPGAGSPVDSAYRDGVLYLGRSDGTLQIIDVRDVDAPLLLGSTLMPAPIQYVLLQGDLVIVVYSDGFQVLSVADPGMIEVLSPVMAVDANHRRAVWREGLVYIARRDVGIQVWDVADPSLPRLVGEASGPSQDLYLGDDYLVAAGAVYPLHCSSPTAVDDAPRSRNRWLRADPNPFNPRTSIRFTLPVEMTVRVEVYDIRGRYRATLFEGLRAAGEHAVRWDGRDRSGRPLPSGTYFVRLSGGSERHTIKVSLLR